MEKRDTLGKKSLESQDKLQDVADHTVAERIKEAVPTYIQTLTDSFLAGKKEKTGDFFIELCVKMEKLFWNVDPRWIPHVRTTCPTPMFEQSVYYYNSKEDILEYLWTIPDIHTCAYLLHNALTIPNEQRELLNFVIDFKEGKLLKIAKHLNSETESIIA